MFNWLKSVSEHLLEKFYLLIFVAGVTLLVLGLWDGIRYNNYFPIEDGFWRYSTAIVGVGLMMLGYITYLRQRHFVQEIRSKDIGVTIRNSSKSEKSSMFEAH